MSSTQPYILMDSPPSSPPDSPPSSPKSQKSSQSKKSKKQPKKGAGILFYRDNTFLTGFSHHLQRWSGFGGKIEKTDKSIFYAAIREVIEEIYGFSPADALIDRLQHIKVQKTLDRNGYTLYVCDIDEIKWIGALFTFFSIKAPYYNSIPKNIVDLITKRQAPPNAEVTKLEFISQSTLQEMYTDHHFLKDTMVV